MQRIFIIILLFAMTATMQAQNENNRPRMSRGGDRANRNRQEQTDNNSGLPELSTRAQIMNERMTQDVGNARWMRIMLREIDLTKEKNGPLYYPVQESNGDMNLFTTLFHLVNDGKIKVYKYQDGYESFEEDNQLSFKDMLDNCNIFYEEVPGGGNSMRYVINSTDIPSAEVKYYYVKEAWYFDQNNSLYDVKTLAVCPIAMLLTDIGEQRTPMFWAKYEDISPYIKNKYIMTSNINNAKTFTIDDFFRRRMFEGDIIKTENMLNLALQEYCPTPDSLKAEQQKIENQLVAFRDSLWIPEDTTLVLDKKAAKKLKKASKSKSSGVSSDDKKSSKGKKEKAPKPEKAKAEKSSATRSIRRR